jgi:hypothetical protein
MAEEIATGNSPEMEGFTSNSVEVEKLYGSFWEIISTQKETSAASIEDKKRISEATVLLEKAKKEAEKKLQEMEQLKVSQAQILKAQEEKMRKNIEELKAKQTEIVKTYENLFTKNVKELQFAKLELQSTKVDLARKELSYITEIEKLKLGIKKEVLVKKSAFSKFVIPVEVKK